MYVGDNTNDNNNALLSGRYEGVLTSLRLVRREGDDFHKKAEKEISLLLEQAQREAAESKLLHIICIHTYTQIQTSHIHTYIHSK